MSHRRLSGAALAAVTAPFALGLALVHGAPARAAGLEGANGAAYRLDGRLGVGMDTVGGLGTSGYGYGDLTVRGDLTHHGLALGALVALRYDVASYDYALHEWTNHRGPGFAVQLTAGYDGEAFHLSAGPWWYGEKRENGELRQAFLPTVFPFGVVRLRVGRLDRGHTTFTLSDGSPFTTSGGAAFRLTEYLPAYLGCSGEQVVRLSVGIYYNVWEETIGAVFTRELQRLGGGAGEVRKSFDASRDAKHGATLIWGLALGTQAAGSKLGRIELGAFIGHAIW